MQFGRPYPCLRFWKAGGSPTAHNQVCLTASCRIRSHALETSHHLTHLVPHVQPVAVQPATAYAVIYVVPPARADCRNGQYYLTLASMCLTSCPTYYCRRLRSCWPRLRESGAHARMARSWTSRHSCRWALGHRVWVHDFTHAGKQWQCRAANQSQPGNPQVLALGDAGALSIWRSVSQQLAVAACAVTCSAQRLCCSSVL